MSYTLQAIIGHEDNLTRAVVVGTRVVRLGGGLAMIPLTSKAQESMKIPSFPLIAEGNATLDISTDELCRDLSSGCRVAYVEAEYFGGTGTQACALFEDGRMVEDRLKVADAINHALRFLGIRAVEGKDEFDIIGLGQERWTDDWVVEDAV